MKVQYLFQCPGHDVLLGDSELCLPFKVTPTQLHPFLTLRDYFDTIKSFILEQVGDVLEKISEQILRSPITLDDVEKILIRSEKHGAFHHVASIEFITNKGPLKFALAAFLSSNKHWFENEYSNLQEIEHHSKPYQFTPMLYFRGQKQIIKDGQVETFYFIVSEWLEGFYEWHLGRDQDSKSHNIIIWDHDHGHYRASRQQASQVFYKIGFILGTCYDPNEYRRINLWSNAAGDFVVGCGAGLVDVRLTTVRDYAQVVAIEAVEPGQLLMPMTFFFLETLTLVRLDRHEGVGDLIWCDEWCLYPTAKGIIDAFEQGAGKGKLPPAAPLEFLALLRSFTAEEIAKLLGYTLNHLENVEPELSTYVAPKLGRHAREICATIRRFQI